MRAEWDQRARENAYHYVASSNDMWSEEDFDRSGRESVEHTVVDDFQRIAGSRDPKTMTMLEIGCGVGRMTKRLSDIFGEVHAVDVSGEMIAKAKERLTGRDNVHLYLTDGVDLAAIGNVELDFALSYIVFQHIPDVEVIRGYIRQVAERLRPGALFKFQVQGSPNVELADRDTWTGARLPALDAVRLARECQLRIEAFEGVGEHYFWLWMRKDTTRGTEMDAVEADLLEAESESTNAALIRLGRQMIEQRHCSDKQAEELCRAVDRIEQLSGEVREIQRRADEAGEALRKWMGQTAERTEGLEGELQEARVRFRDLLQRSDQKADELRAHLNGLYGSWAYRIGRRLGLAPQPIQEKNSE